MATVSFSQKTYSVGENKDTLTVSVVRSGDIESTVVVLIANHPYGGTATGKYFLLQFILSLTFPFSLLCMYPYSPHCHVAGQDYFTVIKILEFESGVTEKEVEINIIDDKFIEVDENFVLYLSSGAGVYLSPFAQAEVIIINNDGRYYTSVYKHAP